MLFCLKPVSTGVICSKNIAMKTSLKTIFLLASAALFTLSSFADVQTDPVGYVTETIKPAQFNTFGINVHGPVVLAGAIDSVDGVSLTDDDADFTTGLASGSEYYVKISSGESEKGLNTGISVVSGTVIETDDDLSSAISSGATYTIRKVLTIADLFGENNEVELLGANAGDITSADIVWLPDSSGGYTKIYYNSVARTSFPPLTVGWKSLLTGNNDASETPVYFTSGILIQVKRSAFGSTEEGVDPTDVTSKNIVFAGSVDTVSSQVILENGFNAISRVLPADVTLGQSELELDITGATAGDITNADIIWIPDGLGGYEKYYYNATARTTFPPLSVGWKGILTGNSDASGENLSSGFFIQRKGSAKMVTLRIPSTISL